jgi:hypothetical protein
VITRRDVLEATAFNVVLGGMAVAAIHHASDVLVALSGKLEFARLVGSYRA